MRNQPGGLGISQVPGQTGSSAETWKEAAMAQALAEKTCTPCRGGVPPLTRQEVARFHPQAAEWQVLDDAHRIERKFKFPDFRAALDFVHQVGELAETEGHHPDVSFGWGHATVSLQTKKIKGLHENDFIMAAKVDRIFDRIGAS
jgi:4a-hydroxytetrahydrobiopterin dehydratase